MNYSSFFIHLVWVSLTAVAFTFLQNFIPAFSDFLLLSWVSIIVFVVLSIVMYFSSYAAAHSPKKGRFTALIMGFTLIKMLLAVCIVVLYLHFTNPITKLFVFPFFLIYLIYTSFEIWFMTKLGNVEAISE